MGLHHNVFVSFLSLSLTIFFVSISSEKSKFQVFLKNGGPRAFRIHLFCFDPKMEGLTYNLGEGVQAEDQKSTFIGFNDKTKCRDNKLFLQVKTIL